MRWNPVWTLLPLVPWILVAALALMRPNRGRAAWILVLVIMLLWINMPPLSHGPKPSPEVVAAGRLSGLSGRAIGAMYLPFIAVLLLSHKLVGKSGKFKAASVVLIVMATAAIYLFCALGLALDQNSLVALGTDAKMGLIAGAYTLSILFSGFVCRRKCTARRFNAWFGRAICILAILGIGAFFLGALIVGQLPMMLWKPLFVVVLIESLIGGPLLYLFAAPLLLFLFLNREYRRRFDAIMGIAPTPELTRSELAAQAEELTLSRQTPCDIPRE